MKARPACPLGIVGGVTDQAFAKLHADAVERGAQIIDKITGDEALKKILITLARAHNRLGRIGSRADQYRLGVTAPRLSNLDRLVVRPTVPRQKQILECHAALIATNPNKSQFGVRSEHALPVYGFTAECAFWDLEFLRSLPLVRQELQIHRIGYRAPA